MSDPVIIASGETYERSCIQKWLARGNNTCPKTGVQLSHTHLAPNHVLQRIIVEWCGLHNIEKLSSPTIEVQRYAAYNIRLLSKKDDNLRIYIAEQGAIPLLFHLLLSPDVKTQEHAITALLNLSIYKENKDRIMCGGAIELVIEVLKSGCMEARENAAAMLFSLSLVDKYKVTIGSSGAIPVLITLLYEGTARGKNDAVSALFSLSVYIGNRQRAVQAGAIPPLMRLIADQSGTMLDEALGVLTLLTKHQEGRTAIGAVGPTPILVTIIESESQRNKENAASILLELCLNDGIFINQTRELNVIEPLTSMAISQDSTDRAKRKASALLELLKEPEVSDNSNDSICTHILDTTEEELSE